MKKYILPLLCLAFSVYSNCYGLEIRLRPSAEIKGVSITLADLADFDEQSSDLARAVGSQIVSSSPPPGQDVTLQAAELQRGLRTSLDVPDSVEWTGSAQVRVHRDGMIVGPDKTKTIISEFLQKHQADLPAAEVQFVPNSLPLPFILPVGNLTWDVIPSHPGILTSTTMSIIFSVDGRVRKNIAIQGHLEAIAFVAVASSTIKRGSIIGPDQVRMIKQDIANCAYPCFESNEIIGEKSNRDIKEGSIIERVWVDIPPMVARGQTVKIILNNGVLHLTTMGVARADGSKNQVIQVANSSSNKIVSCRVTAPGIVEVQL